MAEKVIWDKTEEKSVLQMELGERINSMQLRKGSVGQKAVRCYDRSEHRVTGNQQLLDKTIGGVERRKIVESGGRGCGKGQAKPHCSCPPDWSIHVKSFIDHQEVALKALKAEGRLPADMRASKLACSAEGWAPPGLRGLPGDSGLRGMTSGRLCRDSRYSELGRLRLFSDQSNRGPAEQEMPVCLMGWSSQRIPLAGSSEL
eukprot:1161469-Pelagomonas_calceolata.AAC.55